MSTAALIGNEIAPIQLAQCRFLGLAIFNGKIIIFFSKKNIRKQFYQTALGNCYGLKLPKCWLQFKKIFYCVIYYNCRHTFVPYSISVRSRGFVQSGTSSYLAKLRKRKRNKKRNSYGKVNVRKSATANCRESKTTDLIRRCEWSLIHLAQTPLICWRLICSSILIADLKRNGSWCLMWLATGPAYGPAPALRS